MQCLYHVYLEEFEKLLARPIDVHNNFQEGVGHYTEIKIGHLKQMGKLWKSRFK